MKILITSYTFDASAQTITFSSYASISLDKVLVVTNVTDNIIIYNFADSSKGGSVSTNVLTLTYDTTSMSDTDNLQIWYEDTDLSGDTTGLATAANQQTDALTDNELRASAVSVDGSGVTQPISAASLPLPTGAATSANQQTDALTDTELRASDVKITLDGESVSVSSQPVRDRLTDNQAVAIQTDVIMNDTTALTPKFIKIDLSASGDLISAVAGKKIRVTNIVLIVTADTTVKFQTGATTDLTGAMTIKAGGGFTSGYDPTGHFETVSGEKLNLVLGTATQVSGWIKYIEV